MTAAPLASALPTLADQIARNAGFAPDKIALRFAGHDLTYAGLSGRIEAAAAALAREHRIGHGDRIAHLGFNSADMLVLLYAAARLGAMLVPLNWRLAAPEHAYIATDAEPALLVVEAAFADRIEVCRAVCPKLSVLGLGGTVGVPAFEDLVATGTARSTGGGRLADPLLIVYTSGTTGRPKGAVLTQDALAWNAVNSVHMQGLTAADHVLSVLPLFHVGGLNIQTTPALMVGATVTLHARFTPETTLAAIVRGRPSLTVLVPAALQAVLDHPAFAVSDLSSLRAITTGSTIVAESYVEAFAARGLRVLQVYGSTETGPIAIYERFDQPRTRSGSTGLTGLLNEAFVADDAGRPVASGAPGEIVLRGPNLFAGYWRDAAATAAAFRDGWYLTGDIATRDGDGHFFVRDRKKNVIISGGENIYPAEVERVIAEFPGIAECAVVGRADPKWQEVAVALVVARAGEVIDAAALSAHLAANLARYKLPREIIVRGELPRNALGKVQHYLLKAELACG